jgi:D-aspartate ligase
MRRAASRRRHDGPPAVVLGDIDLVRPLAAAGIPCAVFAEPYDPVRLSRQVSEVLRWSDPWEQPEAVVETLLEYASRQDGRPVLMPQGDGELLVVSRHRERLGSACSFLLADAELVEDLVDKGRFLALADRLGLPVARTRRLSPADTVPGDLDLRFPVLIKPLHRQAERWQPIEPAAKARHVEDGAELARLWALLRDAAVEVLAQEVVPGPETRVESYHTYVDPDGATVAEFTGRKIRTVPARYGHSTAVEITDVPDVAALGREVVERLGLVGVAKADFKRGPDGSLTLLEVNPRFTLWHNPAAIAGANMPALLHADVTGRPRPATARPRPGVTWCLPLSDLRAVREEGLELRAWLRFLRRCDAISGLTLRDPLPLFPGAFVRAAARRINERLGTA